MPRKTAANDSATPLVRAAKPKTPKSAPVVEVTSRAVEVTPKAIEVTSKTAEVSRKAKVAAPRVKSATHKTDAPVVVVEMKPAVNRHEQIAKIAYGYWEARGYQPGSPEEDWLRAEQEFLLTA